jgi:nicotinate-nucleotide--dimethylbenzimidazole phosphoribosyltransferase
MAFFLSFMKEQLQQKIDQKTKPLGALGTLETIALQIGVVQNTLTPTIAKPHIVVFAADHGIAAEGKVNPYPQAVTAQMVLNFVNGGAAINVFCKQNNIGLTVVDAGVNVDFDKDLSIIHAKVKKGTANYTMGWAMSEEEMDIAFERAEKIVHNIYKQGCNTIGFGEMGIGNTSSASLIMHHYLGLPVSECVGRGTGANDEQLKTKIEVLQDCSELYQLTNAELTSQGLVCRVGGFEIAMMVAAFLKAVELKMIIVVDGFIATAAFLVAQKINGTIMENAIFAHTSGEQGHQKMLEHLQVKPLLNLGMRLGEGTGAALAMPLLQSACAFVNEMSSFESAGVATANDSI